MRVSRPFRDLGPASLTDAASTFQVLSELEKEREIRRDMLGMFAPAGAVHDAGAGATAGGPAGGKTR